MSTEMEALLRAHPLVRRVSLAQTAEGVEARVTLDEEALRSAAPNAADTGVRRWTQLFERAYAELPAAGDPRFAIHGWIAGDGSPIPEAEMREWLDTTVARIEALAAPRLLEIGCGSGLLLFRLAARASRYAAIDPSPAALDHVRRWLSPEEAERVTLRLGAAHQLDFDERFDGILLNSVVQYFPSVDYLVGVLERALGLLAPGGAIFIGDVRDLRLLARFEASLGQPPPARSELAIAPALFESFAASQPALGEVRVELKRGHALNELLRYRYDVVLRKCAREPFSEVAVEWSGLDAVAPLVAAHPRLRVRGIPNARLDAAGIAPERLFALAALHEREVSLAPGAAETSFDARFRPQRSPFGWRDDPPPVARGRWHALATDPLAGSRRRFAVSRLEAALASHGLSARIVVEP